MRKCIRCSEWKDKSGFNIRNREKGYLQSVCISCQQQDSRDRYLNDPEYVKERNRISRQKGKERARQVVYEHLTGSQCADCGETDIEVLTFDHVTGEKKYNIADMIQNALGAGNIKNEIEKTEVVCFNCHMKRERKRRGSFRFSL
jgi:hypothetical protein